MLLFVGEGFNERRHGNGLFSERNPIKMEMHLRRREVIAVDGRIAKIFCAGREEIFDLSLAKADYKERQFQ